MGKVLLDGVGELRSGIKIASGKNIDLASGKYAISNIASLPTAFTEVFNSQIFSTTASYGGQTDLNNGLYVSVHALVTEVDGSLAGGELAIQGSNVGGTSADAWSDVSSPVAITSVGSYMLELSEKIKNYKYIRVRGVTTTADFTAYLVIFGQSNTSR